MDPVDAQIAEMHADSAKRDRRTPLVQACADLNVETALALIAKGEALATPDRQGRTPLHEVARQAYKDEEAALQIVTALLDAGVPIDPADKLNSQTPLIEAAIYTAPKVLQLLIARGANVNHKMKDGLTVLGALTATTSMMRGRAKVIKMLEAAGGIGRKR